MQNQLTAISSVFFASDVYRFHFTNHKSLLYVCCTLSMERTPHYLRKPRQIQSPALCPITHGISSSSPSSLSPLASSIGRVSYIIYVSMRHYVLTISGDIVVCFHTAACLSY